MAIWAKKDVREFTVPIQNRTIAYIMSLSFRYADGYQPQVVKVNVTETSPSGKTTLKE